MEKLIAAILGGALFAANVSPARADWRGRGEEWRRGGEEWRRGGEEWHHRQHLNGGWETGSGGAGSGLGRGLPFVSPSPFNSQRLAPPTYNNGPRCGFPYC
jgi:hypothetical protein